MSAPAPILKLLELRTHVNPNERARLSRPLTRRRALVRAILLDILSALDTTPPKPIQRDDLPPKSMRLVRASTAEPATAKKLARLAGVSWNSSTRAALADLVRDGLLFHGPEGYWSNFANVTG